MPKTWVLGLDLGTSAIKVVAMDRQSTVLARGEASFATISDTPGQAEQDPREWLAALSRAMGVLAQTLSATRADWPQQVAGIGVTGQLPTLVCLGAEGTLGRAITWKDARADAATGTWVDASQRRRLYERTGMPIDGRYLGPMFRHHWHARRDAVRTLLSAKDFIVWALTGRSVTDPSTAAGYALFDLDADAFDPALCELWRVAPDQLPAVASAHATAGVLNAAGAALLRLPAGIPVAVGAADSVSSAFAMAGLEEGIASVTMGSSTIILDAVRARPCDPAMRYLLTPHVERGWFGREMDLLATGTGHRWLCDLLRMSGPELDRCAADSPPGADGLLFSPYLAGGEQGALWEPSLRGAVSGLHVRHRAQDLARAFLEGVGYEIRRCIDVLAESVPIRQIVLAGHLSEQPSSLSMLTDILDRPITVEPPGSPAACGAALIALKMLGASADSSTPGMPARHRVEPGAHAAVYRDLYQTYLQRTAAQRLADAAMAASTSGVPLMRTN